EVREADILVHVVDISHPSFEDHIRAVNETLKDLGALDKPTIMVFNKIDAYRPADHESGLNTLDDEAIEAPVTTLEDFEKSWMSKNNSPAIFISATEKTNVEAFRKLLYDKIVKLHTERYPYDNLLY